MEWHQLLQGRGTVVTGRVEQGVVKTGDNVEIVGLRPSMQTTVTGAAEASAVLPVPGMPANSADSVPWASLPPAAPQASLPENQGALSPTLPNLSSRC